MQKEVLKRLRSLILHNRRDTDLRIWNLFLDSPATKCEKGIMPPPAVGRSIPGPSAAVLPCRSKAQELRSDMSSNSLRFLTPGRAKRLIAFGS